MPLKQFPNPAATAVAEMVVPHLSQHVAQARERHRGALASVPSAEIVEAIIQAAFWASLRREEGYPPKISLAYVAPDETVSPLRFARGLTLAAAELAHLAPAVERPGIHLGVWRDSGQLCVWGTTRELPAFCFVLEVVAPGMLVVKHTGPEASRKFVNVAVLEGDEIKMLDEGAAKLADCPALLTSLLGFDSPRTSGGSPNLLVQLAVSMRDHGRGGLLLVVPSKSEEWRHSILHPITYAVSPAFGELSQLAQAEQPDRAQRDAIRRAVAAIGGLTAVDGATILTNDHKLLAFGAKIVRRDGAARVEQVVATEPIAGASPAFVNPTQLGGTRHLSAAQFVHDQHDAIALVASQDGRFTVFAWSPCEGMVHAHRVEALLL